ncbi:hypothetical protein [Pseudomonas sp. NFACC42-2]|uniref:hypothetical protein n=1 Tax=Pseudomonas sp. NFACC42-2 TaxID=1566193 RepID=UPI0008E743A1|nr:hypothetical protein [Pseudomonas sp. NFACC42-2]SFS24136.1 hypothetical protein SAMN03159318_00367 [Pseudomonas sp. NFACC42-2]
MLILMSSPNFVIRNGRVDPELVKVIADTRAAKNPVGFVSNGEEPAWFAESFANTGVQFLQCKGRQNGEVISRNAIKFKLNSYDVIVLAVKDEDVQMGKNGGAVLVAAGWSTAQQVRNLGIRVDDYNQLREVIQLTESWRGEWWYKAKADNYNILALADLSEYGKDITQQEFGKKLTSTVKNGGGRLNALLAVTARSLLIAGIGRTDSLMWGVYPSSNSSNNDSEVLSDFTHRLRTTVSRVHFSKRGQPLFIRHTASAKRSKGGGGDRTDPSEQVQTIHLNSFYKGKLKGKNVIVVDDCTTYGVSFGVAAAFLMAAGAASVTGIALGKFGNQLRQYQISIKTDPYMPISKGGYSVDSQGIVNGVANKDTQQNLLALIP